MTTTLRTSALAAVLLASLWPASAPAATFANAGAMCVPIQIGTGTKPDDMPLYSAAFHNRLTVSAVVFCPIWWNSDSIDPGTIRVAYEDLNGAADVSCNADYQSASGMHYFSATVASSGKQAYGSPPQFMTVDTGLAGGNFFAGATTTMGNWGLTCVLPPGIASSNGYGDLSGILNYISTQN
jgi:hypothetical protein